MEFTNLVNNTRQFLFLKEEIGSLSSRQSEIKSRLLSELDELDADDRGHKVFEFEDIAIGKVKVTKQRRVVKPLDMEIAEKILTARGIRDSCVKTITVLDDAAIMAAYYSGYLTEEDIDAMFPQKESFALLVENKSKGN